MKQGTITRAYKELQKLEEINGIPFKAMSRIHRIVKKMEPYIEAQQTEEIKAVKEFADIEPDGKIVYHSDGDAEKLNVRLGEIQNAEVDWEDEPVDIPYSEKMDLNGKTIGVLEDFINFVEEE